MGSVFNSPQLGKTTKKEAKNRILKEYNIPLLNNYGKPRYDDNGNPLRVIVFDPINMKGRTFFTKRNKDGETKRARVVELINEFNKELEQNKEHHKFLNDIKYRVFYDTPSAKKNQNVVDGDVYLDSAIDNLLIYNEVCDYLIVDCNGKDGEKLEFYEFLDHMHTQLCHKG